MGKAEEESWGIDDDDDDEEDGKGTPANGCCELAFFFEVDLADLGDFLELEEEEEGWGEVVCG